MISPPSEKSLLDFLVAQYPLLLMIAPKHVTNVQKLKYEDGSGLNNLQRYSKMLEDILGPRLQSYKRNMFGGYNQDLNDINNFNKLSIVNLLTDRPQDILRNMSAKDRRDIFQSKNSSPVRMNLHEA